MARLPLKGIGAAAGSGLLALAAVFAPSPEVVQRISAHEGTRLAAYLDPVKIPTICTGSTKGVYMGMRLTQAQCDARLRADLEDAAKFVRQFVLVPITQNQFDSLVSFVFNVGGYAFKASTMLKHINAGQCYSAAQQFDRWVYAKEQKLPGLVTRRADERMWFEQDCKLWK